MAWLTRMLAAAAVLLPCGVASPAAPESESIRLYRSALGSEEQLWSAALRLMDLLQSRAPATLALGDRIHGTSLRALEGIAGQGAMDSRLSPMRHPTDTEDIHVQEVSADAMARWAAGQPETGSRAIAHARVAANRDRSLPVLLKIVDDPSAPLPEPIRGSEKAVFPNGAIRSNHIHVFLPAEGSWVRLAPFARAMGWSRIARR